MNKIESPKWVNNVLSDSTLPEYALQNLNQEKDQYYTKSEIAQKCYNITIKWLKDNKYNINDYILLEPSAGTGVFFNLMPHNNRLGLDIEPKDKDIKEQDILKWQPDINKKYIAIGNPPFGKRGIFAKTIIERLYHCNVDVIAMILPMGFSDQSVVIPKYLEKLGYYIKYCEELPEKIFITPSGKTKSINTSFIILDKNKPDTEKDTCDSYIDCYVMEADHNSDKPVGIDKRGKCDIYIRYNFYKSIEKQMYFDNYNDVSGFRCLGIDIKKNRKEIKELLKNYDYTSKHSSNSGMVNITTKDIKNILINKGYVDKGTCDSYVKYYRIEKDISKNTDNVSKCDLFIEAHFYASSKNNIYNIDFNNTKGNEITGVQVLKDKGDIIKVFEKHDYKNTRVSTKSMINFRKRELETILIEAGYTDE